MTQLWINIYLRRSFKGTDCSFCWIVDDPDDSLWFYSFSSSFIIESSWRIVDLGITSGLCCLLKRHLQIRPINDYFLLFQDLRGNSNVGDSEFGLFLELFIIINFFYRFSWLASPQICSGYKCRLWKPCKTIMSHWKFLCQYPLDLLLVW